MNDIAKNIKKLRQKKKLTQEELAEKLFVTRQAVSNWETGKNQPDVDMLKNLSEVLEVDIKDLLYGLPTDESRRKRFLFAIILCILAAAVWVILSLLWEGAMRRRVQFYDTHQAMIPILAVRPLAYCLTGAALSLWKELRPAKARVRCGLLAVGAALLGAYLFGMWAMYHGLGTYYYGWINWVGYYPWTFLIPGSLLFLGWPVKRGTSLPERKEEGT